MKWEKPELKGMNSQDSASAGCTNGSSNASAGTCGNGGQHSGGDACATGGQVSPYHGM